MSHSVDFGNLVSKEEHELQNKLARNTECLVPVRMNTQGEIKHLYQAEHKPIFKLDITETTCLSH
jgi:hypothetical protein